MSTAPKPVKFNVGGKRFEISQSLLDRFPNTMISRAASKTWNATESGSNDQDSDINDSSSNSATAVREVVERDEIFIERDGSKFQLVLDYMRDRKISLPISVTKQAILDELSYYCFDDIDTNCIDDSSIYNPVYLHTIQDELKKRKQQVADSIDKEIEILDRKQQILRLIDCIVKNINEGDCWYTVINIEEGILRFDHDMEMTSEDREFCNSKLESLGVCIDSVATSARNNLSCPKITVDLRYVSGNVKEIETTVGKKIFAPSPSPQSPKRRRTSASDRRLRRRHVEAQELLEGQELLEAQELLLSRRRSEH